MKKNKNTLDPSLTYADPEVEPAHGSVVLAFGPSGTAYQRFFSDGVWHGTQGDVVDYSSLVIKSHRPLILLLDVPEDAE